MNKKLLGMLLGGVSVWATTTEPAQIKQRNASAIRSSGYVARNSGKIELQLDIDAKGSMRGARIVKGRPDLAQMAVQTVRGWQFEPAKMDGKSVKSKINVILAFDFDSRR